MSSITENFGTLYHPKCALIFFASDERGNDMYVEHYDMDTSGTPVNAHPLTVNEADRLARALKLVRKKNEAPMLKPKGILAKNILYVDSVKSKAVWHTKSMHREMYFVDKLEIPNGRANVPPLLWCADRSRLYLFALKSNNRPNERTNLYHAPFFNVYKDGDVCMGTVDVQIKRTASLEEFINAWEDYFFNSYFSHLVNEHNPVNGNCVLIWKDLVTTGKSFPMEVLRTSNISIKNLMR